MRFGHEPNTCREVDGPLEILDSCWALRTTRGTLSTHTVLEFAILYFSLPPDHELHDTVERGVDGWGLVGPSFACFEVHDSLGVTLSFLPAETAHRQLEACFHTSLRSRRASVWHDRKLARVIRP